MALHLALASENEWYFNMVIQVVVADVLAEQQYNNQLLECEIAHNSFGSELTDVQNCQTTFDYTLFIIFYFSSFNRWNTL